LKFNAAEGYMIVAIRKAILRGWTFLVSIGLGLEQSPEIDASLLVTAITRINRACRYVPKRIVNEATAHRASL